MTTWILVGVIAVLALTIAAGVWTFLHSLGRAYQQQLSEWEIAERLRPVSAVNGHVNLRPRDPEPDTAP